MPTTNHSRESAADSVTRSQLRFLLDLLASGKLSRTASHLGMSLSAASRTLDRLREAFGDPLFTPHARGLTPTDTMLQIEPELRRTIAQTDRLFSLRTLDLSRLERIFSMSAWGIVVPEMLANPLRIAVCRADRTPQIDKTLCLIGREEVAARMAEALAL